MTERSILSPDGPSLQIGVQNREPNIPENPVFRHKWQTVLSILKTNLKESEFKVICYAAACSRGLVKPFPSHLIDDSEEGLEALNGLNRKILKLGILRQYLENDGRFSVGETVIELLHWLLFSLQKTRRLEIVPGSSRAFVSILGLVKDGVDLTLPTECFKLKFWSRSTENLQWEELRAETSTKTAGFAFMTTQIDQLHALIHLGVAPFATTDEALGSSVELTTNLGECLKAVRSQWVWGKNSIGLQLKIVTLVEFLQDHAKIIENESPTSGTKYFVRPKAVRPRFFLVYNQPCPKLSSSNVPVIAATSYRFRDRFIYHLPCIFAYLGVGLFLVKQTEIWHNWSFSGARSALGNLCDRFS